MPAEDEFLLWDDSMSVVVVTETDRAMATEAMIDGHEKCPRSAHDLAGPFEDCGCHLGRIDGCKTRREAIAQAIAKARKM